MLDLTGTTPVASRLKPNLEPVRQPSHLEEILAGLSVVIVGVVVGVVFLFNRSVTTALARLDGDYQTLLAETQTGELGAVATQASLVARGLEILRVRKQDDPVWSKLFHDLELTTSAGVELRSLAVDERNILTIEGQAESFQRLAEYLATLRASTKVVRADLLSASLVDSKDANRVTFSLSVNLKASEFSGGSLTTGRGA